MIPCCCPYRCCFWAHTHVGLFARLLLMYSCPYLRDLSRIRCRIAPPVVSRLLPKLCSVINQICSLLFLFPFLSCDCLLLEKVLPVVVHCSSCPRGEGTACRCYVTVPLAQIMALLHCSCCPAGRGFCLFLKLHRSLLEKILPVLLTSCSRSLLEDCCSA